MLPVFLSTLSPVMIMFGLMIAGVILKRCNVLPENGGAVISKLIANLLIPALIINNFSTNCTVSSIKTEYIYFLLGILMTVISVAVAIPLSGVFEKKEPYTRNVYKYALAFANFGFMGYSIVPVIMGSLDERILYKFLLFTLPINIVSCVWGANILTIKKDTSNPFKKLLTPVFIACIIGAVIGITETQKYIPDEIMSIIKQLEVCMTPLAMLVTGFIIGGFPFKKLITYKRAYVFSLLRLIVFPLLMVGLMMLLGVDKTILLMTVFAIGTPLGLNAIVFPAANGGDVLSGSSLAMVSTTISLITLPVLYSVVYAL